MKIPFESREKLLECAEQYGGNEKAWEMERSLEGWEKVEEGREFITLDELRILLQWKAARARNRIEPNSDDDVRLASRLAFREDVQGAWKLGILSLLYGVKWPVASCILHFAYDGDYSEGKTPKHGGYPIVDIWAMKAVGGDEDYTPEKWDEYVKLCRDAAREHQVSMRTLDRALWIFGKHFA